MSEDKALHDAASVLREVAQRVSVLVRLRRAEYYTWRALSWGLGLGVLPLLLKEWLGGYALALALAATGLSLVVGLVYALSRPIPALEAARLADRAVGLQDRLPTAMECIQRRDQSPLARAVVVDAAERAPAVFGSRMIPRRWPWETRWLPIPAIGVLVLALAPPIPIPRVGLPAWERVREAQEEPRRAESASHQDRPLEQRREVAERMERPPQDFPRRSQRTGTAQGDLAASFRDTTLAQRRPDFSSFLKQGDDRLRVLERVGDLPDLQGDFTESQNRMAYRKMRDLLAGARPDQLSPQRLRELLEEMARLGRRGDGGADEDLREGEEALGQGQLSRALSALERAFSRMRAQQEREQAKKGLQGGKEQGQPFGEQGREGEGDDLGEGSLPGKGHLPDRKGGATTRVPGDRVDMSLGGESRQGRREAYETNLRGRGGQHPSRLPYLSVFSQYRKLMEEALAKEAIPFDYRTQIKEYFQSLEER